MIKLVTFLYFLDKETIHFQRIDSTKKLRFRSPSERNLNRKSSKLVKKYSFSALDSLTLAIRVFLLAPMEQGGHLHKGDLFHVFKETKKGQRALFALAAFK